MSGQITDFVSGAKTLSKSPLGVISLFIVLVYGLASLVVIFGAALDAKNKEILVWFLVSFPFFVFSTFTYLVVKHPKNLYSPKEFASDDGFLKALDHAIDRSIEKKVLNAEDKINELVWGRDLAMSKEYMRGEQYDEALEYVNRALAISQSPRALGVKAQILRRLSRIGEAIELLELMIKSTDDTYLMAIGHWNKGCYMTILERNEEAVIELEKSIELRPSQRERLLTDADLFSLHDNNAFKRLLSR